MINQVPGYRAGEVPGIIFFGAYDPTYPRNLIFRKGWQKLGLGFSECRVGTKRKVHTRYPLLLARFFTVRRRERAIFVPDFRHKDVPLARALATISGRKLIFDPLVSRYETRVLDRGDVTAGSVQAWHNRNLDRISFMLSDVVIADTSEHARFFRAGFGIREDKLRIIPVGFDEDTFAIAPHRRKGDALEVLFYGSFLPLHGIETIIEAASGLVGEPVHFRLVGEGQTYWDMRGLSDRLGLENIDFLQSVPAEDLPRLLAESDIVLGIFGTTQKASLVVPNKVYQALAVGRAVVTADTPAIREFFRGGEHLLTVPQGDPRALVDAIRALGADESLRMRLAESGGRHVRENYNSVRIAGQLARVVKETTN
jgi:glycosyltransferase involved in cell wall biosynthesis